MRDERVLDTADCDPTIVIERWKCFGVKRVLKSNHVLATDVKHKTEWMQLVKQL